MVYIHVDSLEHVGYIPVEHARKSQNIQRREHAVRGTCNCRWPMPVRIVDVRIALGGEITDGIVLHCNVRLDEGGQSRISAVSRPWFIERADIVV
jgi:hypothetical protein